MSDIKVIFKLPQELVEFLETQARKECISVTDVLCRSIDAERFFVEQEEAGNTVLIERKNRDLHQVIRR